MRKYDKNKSLARSPGLRSGDSELTEGRGTIPIRRMAGYASRHRLWKPEDRLLVAVSGGTDSVALLHLLYRLGKSVGLHLTVVHLDHCLRGEASCGDRRWVKELAGRLQLPFITGCREVEPVIKAGGYSLEEAARMVRYDFFREVSRQTGIGILALGHQADDQAETVLLRLLRGGRPAALAGMRPARKEGELTLIRPLLPFWRDELVDFLHEIGEGWREDLTNRDSRFLRNRVRHQLLPLLESEYSPRCRELLVELAERERERDDYLRRRLEARGRELLRETGEGPALDCCLFREAAALEQGEVLRSLLARAGITAPHRRHFSALKRLAGGQSGRRLDLPGLVSAYREGDLLFIAPRRETEESFSPRTLEVPGEIVIEEISARLRARILPVPPDWEIGEKDPTAAAEAQGHRREYLDRDRVALPLTVRSRRPGDRYRPLGMEGRKPVKKILAEVKVPLSHRGLIPVVEDQKRIIWLAVHRPNHYCRVGPDTREVIELSFEPLQSVGIGAGGAAAAVQARGGI